MEGAPSAIKHFQIMQLLGKGGMAEVYLAFDREHDQYVALKVVPPKFAGDINYRKRFLRELEAHSSLQHPNIVRVYDGGVEGAQLYMAMEYVEGWPLDKLIQQTGRLPLPQAIFILREVLNGLLYTHESHIIHRDMKPANILVSQNGEVKITDFGIVKAQESTVMTQVGDVLGSPAYMAPEQILGKEIDASIDLYATGLIFYEMLAGYNPLFDENVHVTYQKALKPNVAPIHDLQPMITDELESILEKLKQPDLGKRYRRAQEILIDLDVAASEMSTYATQEHFVAFLNDPESWKRRFQVEIADYYFQKGKDYYYKDKKLGRALLEFFRAVSANPHHAEASRFLSRLCRKKGFNEETVVNREIELAEAKLKTDPGNYYYLLQVIKCHQAAGNFQDAIRKCHQLLRIKEHDTYAEGVLTSLLSLTHDARAESDDGLPPPSGLDAASRSGRHPSLDSGIRSARSTKPPTGRDSGVRHRTPVPPPGKKSDPDLVETRLLQARQIKAMAEQMDTAQAPVEAEVPVDQPPVEPVLEPHVSSRRRSKSKVAEKPPKVWLPWTVAGGSVVIMVVSLAFRPAPDPYGERGQGASRGPSLVTLTNAEGAFKQANYPQAIKSYERFLKEYTENPVFAEAKFNLAQAHLALGHLREAKVQFQQVIDGHPTSEYRNESLREMARMSLAESDLSGAIQFYAAIAGHLELTPKAGRRGGLLKEYAETLEADGQDFEASRIYDRLLESYKDVLPSADLFFRRAANYVNLQDYARARPLFKRVMEESPRDSELWKKSKAALEEIGNQ